MFSREVVLLTRQLSVMFNKRGLLYNIKYCFVFIIANVILLLQPYDSIETEAGSDFIVIWMGLLFG